MTSLFTRTFGFLLAALLGFAGAAQAQCPTPACQPGRATNSLASDLHSGIKYVVLGATTYTSTGYAEGYRDSSCGRQGITVTAGNSFAFQIKTGDLEPEVIRVYLDANNDGTFATTGSSSELVFSSNGSNSQITGTITVPTTAVLNQRLRLRIATDADIATGLPAPCRTPEYGQTKDYFVIATSNAAPPVAAFTTADSITCSGLVAFADRSQGAPTSWHWSFGDGDTSNLQNPTHQYRASTGSFDVRLIVANANGSDTVTRLNAVRFNDSIPAVACSLGTVGYCCSYGITRVQITSLAGVSALDQSSANASAGYENFTCLNRVRLAEGKSYRVALTTAIEQDVKIWIDANGDGTFADSELVSTILNQTNPSDTIAIPVPTGLGVGHTVRMRVAVVPPNGTLTACGTLQGGQAEDYALLISPNTLPPVAIAERVGGTNCDSTYTFRSTSDNTVTQTLWYFGDGTVDSTSGALATHTYADTGTYTVTLVVRGPYGADTAVLTDAVTYVLAPAQATCGGPGTLGGPFQNIGIRRVQFGTIDVSSGNANEGYQDFTCQGSTAVLAAVPTPFTITVGNNFNEIAAVWIDLNNNHAFEDSEKLLTFPAGTGARTGNITLPATAVMRQALRVRVLSYGANAGAPANPGPCAPIQSGQFEDYSVIILPNLNPPTAGFGAVSRTSCDGRIAFLDSAINATHYLYSFGDGTTDTAASPVHVYPGVGTYTVTQRVYNASGADSLTRQAFITITENLHIAAASCQPTPQQDLQGAGPVLVQFGQIDNATAAGQAEGYKDYTCTQVARLPLDTTLSLTVQVGGQFTQTVSAYIDYNADGQFGTDELLGFANTQNNAVTIPVTFPITALVNRGLRLRVVTDFPNGPTPGAVAACGPLRIGQAEDYAVILSADTGLTPVAGFSSTGRISCSGTVAFRDSSLNQPTSHLWLFGDGGTDTVANPTHHYASTGTYTVTLIARNRSGADTLVRAGYVVYQPLTGLTPAACTPTFTAPTGADGFRSLVVRGQTVLATVATAATGTYQDMTCSFATFIVGYGDTLTVSSELGAVNDQVGIFLDINNDGTFATGELLRTYRRTGFGTPEGYIVIPNAATLNVPLRLRLVVAAATGGGGGGTVSACQGTTGQAVDLTVQVQPSAPRASFTNLSAACALAVSFTSTSAGAPTELTWDFGDNNTGSGAAVQHTYADNGTYLVTLIATNALGSDTATQEITVGPAVTASCQPTASVSVLMANQAGIQQVRLTDVNTNRSVQLTSGSVQNEPGYRDNSCSTRLTVGQGSQVQVRAQLAAAGPGGNNRNYQFYVLVDYNDDGDFEDDGEQVTSTNGQAAQNALTSTFTVPADAPAGLHRLRVQEYLGVDQGPLCVNVTDGQSEDYGLVVTAVAATAPQLAGTFGLQLAPNPARHEVRLSTDLASGPAAILRLIDATGRVVLTRTLTTATETLNVSTLPAGVYQVVLQQGARRALKRLVVEK